MKIKLLEPLVVEKDVIEKLAAPLKEAGHEFIYYDEKTTDLDELKERSKDADILMIANNPLPNEVIESAEKLKMISVAFTGVDHVGREAVINRGLTLCNAAGYSNDSVAELVIGLTLDLLRNITICDTVTRKQGTIAGLIGNELKGKTIGVIGLGRIGTKTAALFKAFDCKIIAYDPCPNAAGRELGVEYLELDEVMSQSDIVSLHLPLTPATRGFISAEKLALMKKTALFINCARGPIVDNEALALMLNQEKIRGAGIDVFDMEPPIPAEYPLLKAKNTILTPHIAFASDESMLTRAEITFDNVERYLAGNPVNVIKFE